MNGFVCLAAAVADILNSASARAQPRTVPPGSSAAARDADARDDALNVAAADPMRRELERQGRCVCDALGVGGVLREGAATQESGEAGEGAREGDSQGERVGEEAREGGRDAAGTRTRREGECGG